MNNRGVKTAANFTVLRETNMPAVIVEAGFMSNPNDLELLKHPSGQFLIASGIVSGLVHYAMERKAE